MGFYRQEYWNGLPFPSARDLLHPRIEPTSLTAPAMAGRFFTVSGIRDNPQTPYLTVNRGLPLGDLLNLPELQVGQ